jgi:hypothetical protein
MTVLSNMLSPAEEACRVAMDVMFPCALRFDGYTYAEQTGKDIGVLADRVCQRQRLLRSQGDNFAAFFSLQRWLGKWGGEASAVTSDGFRAFVLLFFALCERPIPAGFPCFEEYARKWEAYFVPRLSMHLTTARAAWDKVATLEANVRRLGCSFTDSGALHIPNAPGWPVPGCRIFRSYPTGQFAICASSADEADSGEERMLTEADQSAIAADDGWRAARLYLEFMQGADEAVETAARGD